MAVVPNGWRYYRSQTFYNPGQTMPYPTLDKDQLLKIIGNTNESCYTYRKDLYNGWEFEYNYDLYEARGSIGDINALIFDEINGEYVTSFSIDDWSFIRYSDPSSIDINITKFPIKLEEFNAYTYEDSGISFRQFSFPELPSTLRELLLFNNLSIKTTPSIKHTNIKSLYDSFRGCKNLTTVQDFPDNLENLHDTFKDCINLINVPDIPSSVINMYNAFENCTSLTKAPGFIGNTYCERFSYAFKGCTSLTNIDDFVVPDGDKMDNIFYGCTSLVGASNLIVNCKKPTYMFYGCSSLKYPPTSVTKNATSFLSMFYQCGSLESIPDIPKNVSNIANIFSGCSKLESISITIPAAINEMYNAFKNCTNITGTLYFEDAGSITIDSDAFTNTSKPIVAIGNYNEIRLKDYPNIYTNLILGLDNIQSVRCDLNGTLNDEGEYVKLSFNFQALDFDAKLYVPKVYIKNAQQEPQINWVYTDPEGIRHEIPNSTDIEIEHIEAATLETSGSFETIFLASDETVEYSIYVATSMENISQGYDASGNVIRDRYYWNLLSGKAIFTGKDYIFDATPDGKSFKVGGAIDEETEKGFIVGERGIPLPANQYPSTFNGPVTFNSKVSLKDKNDILRELFDFDRPVGSCYFTLDPDFDPNISWGGTWELLPEGYVLLSASDPDAASPTYVAGTSYGANEKRIEDVNIAHGHEFTQPKIPNHVHSITGNLDSASALSGSDPSPRGPVRRGGTGNTWNTNNSGGGGSCTEGAVHDLGDPSARENFNVMQASFAVYIWYRTE